MYKIIAKQLFVDKLPEEVLNNILSYLDIEDKTLFIAEYILYSKKLVVKPILNLVFSIEKKILTNKSSGSKKGQNEAEKKVVKDAKGEDATQNKKKSKIIKVEGNKNKNYKVLKYLQDDIKKSMNKDKVEVKPLSSLQVTTDNNKCDKSLSVRVLKKLIKASESSKLYLLLKSSRLPLTYDGITPVLTFEGINTVFREVKSDPINHLFKSILIPFLAKNVLRNTLRELIKTNQLSKSYLLIRAANLNLTDPESKEFLNDINSKPNRSQLKHELFELLLTNKVSIKFSDSQETELDEVKLLILKKSKLNTSDLSKITSMVSNNNEDGNVSNTEKELIEFCAEYGKLEVLKEIMSIGETQLVQPSLIGLEVKKCCVKASASGHLHVLDYLLTKEDSKGFNIWREIFEMAAKYGQKSIIDFCVTKFNLDKTIFKQDNNIMLLSTFFLKNEFEFINKLNIKMNLDLDFYKDTAIYPDILSIITMSGNMNVHNYFNKNFGFKFVSLINQYEDGYRYIEKAIEHDNVSFLKFMSEINEISCEGDFLRKAVEYSTKSLKFLLNTDFYFKRKDFFFDLLIIEAVKHCKNETIDFLCDKYKDPDMEFCKRRLGSALRELSNKSFSENGPTYKSLIKNGFITKEYLIDELKKEASEDVDVLKYLIGDLGIKVPEFFNLQKNKCQDRKWTKTTIEYMHETLGIEQDSILQLLNNENNDFTNDINLVRYLKETFNKKKSFFINSASFKNLEWFYLSDNKIIKYLHETFKLTTRDFDNDDTDFTMATLETIKYLHKEIKADANFFNVTVTNCIYKLGYLNSDEQKSYFLERIKYLLEEIKVNLIDALEDDPEWL